MSSERLSYRAGIALLFCIATHLFVPCSAQEISDHRLSSQQIQALDDLLAPLRTEYQADLTFQILERGGDSLSVRQKEQLIRRVFENAVKSKYPYPTSDASHTQIGLSHQIATNLRLSGMDTLDMQAKAVGYALAVNPQFAQDLFENLSVRTPHGYSCQTRSIANVSAYYKTVGLLIHDGRLSSVAFNESPSVYLTTLARTMNAPVEVVPMARLLSDKTLSTKELEPALAAFLSSLVSLTATDREMAVMEDFGQLTESIGSLADMYKALGANESPLLKAYREFLIRSLSVEQCGDYSVDRTQVVKRFNDLVRERLGTESNTFSLLTEDELRPLKRTDTSPEPLIPVEQSIIPQIQRLANIKKANQVHDYLSRGASTEQQPDQADMQALLDYVVSSEPKSPGCPLCDFESKMTIVVMLLSYLPPGEALNRTIDLSIDNLLTDQRFEAEEPAEWIKLMRNLLNISRTPDEKGRAVIEDAIKQGMLIVLGPSPAAKEVKSHLRQSPDPIIHAYATVDRMLPIPYKTSNRF